ncbi:hypothetical protein H8E88_05120 [candidate division KSB1 bacterium]|nr:hypothetical protein [candidate division KSB1 bacterium]
MLRKNKLTAVVFVVLLILFSMSGVVLAQTSAKDKAEPKLWSFDQNREHRYLWYGDFDFYNKSFADLTTFALSSAATSGTVRTVTITQTHTGDGAAILEPLRVDINSAVQTGSWANAIVGAINYSGATGDAGGGLAAAMCSEVTLPAISSPAGSYYAHDFEFNAQASYVANTGSAFNVAYLRFGLYGDATAKASFEDEAYFMRVTSEFTDATGNMWYDNTLRIQIETTDWYIPLSSAEGSYTSAYPVVITNTITTNGLFTSTTTTTAMDIDGTSAGADINHYIADFDYTQGSVSGGAYLSRGNLTGVRTDIAAIGNIDHVYATRTGSSMAMAADAETNQFYGAIVNAAASGAHTLTLHDGLVGLQATVTVDAGVTDVTGGLVAALFTNSAPIAKNLTSPTYGIYQKTGGYTDYGIAVQVESNNVTSGIRIQASESAVLPVGLEISTSTGTVTNDILLSSGAKIFTGSAANGDAVYAEVGAYDATGSIYLSTGNGYLYIQVANAGAASDWFKVTATDAD